MHAGEEAAQQDALRMDSLDAEQPLGFRRASAGANLPSGVQAVGMEVCFYPRIEWIIQQSILRRCNSRFLLVALTDPTCLQWCRCYSKGHCTNFAGCQSRMSSLAD